MKIIKSYKAEIQETNISLNESISIYRKALSFIIDIVNKQWYNIKTLKLKEKNNYTEKIIHSTKNNTALYNFDKKFYKFPSYFKRLVIQEAIGIVLSYKSNLYRADHTVIYIWRFIPIFRGINSDTVQGIYTSNRLTTPFNITISKHDSISPLIFPIQIRRLGTVVLPYADSSCTYTFEGTVKAHNKIINHCFRSNM